MPFPVNDSYSCAGGGSIYAGRYNWPSWRQTQLNGTWAQVGSNTLSAINPENNPAINPNYPGAAPWHGITGITSICSTWNGAAFDEDTGNIWFPLQGGHGDYAGNEPYKICLQDNSPIFSMIRNPSGAIGNLITLNDGQEATGLYSDGRLRSIHNYNNNIYVPGVGPVVTRLSGIYTHDSGPQRAYKINETTGEATLICDYTSLPADSAPYGGAVYDPNHGRILMTASGNTPLTSINITTGIASIAVSSNNYVNAYAKLIIIQEFDLLVVIHNGGNGYPAQIYFRDLSSLNTLITPTIAGSYSGGLVLNGQVGAAWDSGNRRLLFWNNATNRTEISTLTPGANPRTDTWTAGVLTVSGSNIEVPTTANSNGTYGRFGYSTKLGGCWLLNAVDQKIYFFATQ